jgi:glycosyltransferase involved in cell wall biosynthesis
VSKSKVILRNWDHEAHYQFGLGMGFYFNGYRQVMRKGEMVKLEIPLDVRMAVTNETLEHLVAQLRRHAGKDAPIVIIDDCSPAPPEPERWADIAGDNPFLYFRLPKNLGCGGKENILQSILAPRCEFVARCDDDVTLDDFSFQDIVDGFNELDDAFAITSCITYFARVEASQLPEGQRYFSGSNMADFVIYKSSVFDEVGYSDPYLRMNEDGELRIRIHAALNKVIYVDKMIGGKATPTGGGNTLEGRIRMSKYVEATRPFVQVIYPKKGVPRFRMNKKMAHEAKLFYVPAHEYATRMNAHLWK